MLGADYPNFRAIPALEAADGRRLRDGLIFRSEALLAPGDAEAVVLARCGIRLVCDLRSAFERARAPNDWWDSQGVEHLHADLLNGFGRELGGWPAFRDEPTPTRARAAMRDLYAAFPVGARDLWPDLFERIAADAVPLLVHCTAGKDRTGFVVAVLLAALGVPRAQIFGDYLLSQGKRSPQVVEATQAMVRGFVGDQLPEDASAAILGVEEGFLDAAFDAIEREHGGVGAYLADCKVGEAEQAAVRDRLLD